MATTNFKTAMDKTTDAEPVIVTRDVTKTVKVSQRAKKAKTAEETDGETNTGRAPDPESQLPGKDPESQLPARIPKNNQLEGEFTSRDVAIPYLNLGQKSGNMCDDHPEWVGTWVFDKAVGLGREVRIIVCHLGKRYEEVTEFGSTDIPQTFATKAAADNAGVQVKDVGVIDLLIESSKKEMAAGKLFSHEGKSYTPARYVVRSTAYGCTVGILLKELTGWLNRDFAHGFYRLGTEKRVKGPNSWFAPKLLADGPVPDDLRALVEEKFGF